MALVRVFGSTQGYEVELARAVLEASGIKGMVQGGNLLAGALTIDHQVELWVAAELADEAEQVLGVHTRRDARGRLSLAPPTTGGQLALVPNTPEACPLCAAPWEQGFEVCWSCGHDLHPQ